VRGRAGTDDFANRKSSTIEDRRAREYRFDIDLLGRRVVAAIEWTRLHPDLQDLAPLLDLAPRHEADAIVFAAALTMRYRRVPRALRRASDAHSASGACQRCSDAGRIRVNDSDVCFCRRCLPCFTSLAADDQIVMPDVFNAPRRSARRFMM
jgi:hypothetical protein